MSATVRDARSPAEPADGGAVPWAQVPPPPQRLPMSVVGAGASMAWIALLGPVVRAVNLPDGREFQLLVIAAAGLLSTALLGARHWATRLALAGATATALLPLQGRLIAIWVGVGILLAVWVVLHLPPLPLLPPPGPGATVPVLALTALAAWRGRPMEATWEPLAAVALAAAVPLVTRIGGGSLARAAAGLGRRAGQIVVSSAFALIGVPLIAGVWLLGRLVRFDPLAGDRGWHRRRRRPRHADRPWGDETGARPRTPGIVTFSAVVLVVAALIGGALTATSSPDPVSGDRRAGSGGGEGLATPSQTTLLPRDGGRVPSSPAQAETDWYRQYRQDVEWVFDERVALRPFEVYRLRDVRTRHVNIVDGYRASWSPPASSCPRARVWIYGGGAAFGLEQRDGHTIASELSRRLLAEGIHAEVSNRGIPGQLHWRTALRFGWDLTTEPPPDSVVFYEGGEDVEGALALDRKGLGDVRAPYEPYIEDLYDELFDVTAPKPPPEGVEFGGWPQRPGSTPASPGELAAARYDRSRELSRTTAAGAGVPVHYVWHPVRPGRSSFTSAYRDAAAVLPPDVVNLTALFDGGGAEVGFVDDLHHGEGGARRVAEELLPLVRADLTGYVCGVGGG